MNSQESLAEVFVQIADTLVAKLDIAEFLQVTGWSAGLHHDPTSSSRPPATHETGRGRGIAVIRGLVDSVIIDVDPAGTRVMLHHPLTVRTGPDVDPRRRRAR